MSEASASGGRRGRALGALLVGALTLGASTSARADVTGVVRDAASGQPIVGAIVQVQVSEAPVYSDVAGRYVLPIAASGARLTAGAKGYFTEGLDAGADDAVDFHLDPVPDDPASPVPFTDPVACVGCHATQVAEWKGSAMAHAGRNAWVEDLYMGTATVGGAGGFVYTRDSVHAGMNPASECASCHQPESWVADPRSALRPMSDPHPSVERGVSCLTCHLMAHVDESRPNDPGIYPGTVRMNRGPSIVRYGALGDVDYHAAGRMRASYQPQLPAVVCGACHQDANDPSDSGQFDGPISEPTYLEWLASPYGDPGSERYQTCMGCHSEPTGAASASNLQVTAARPAGQIRSHRFEGTTPGFLEKALSIRLETRVDKGVLEVDAYVENHGAGHHVPTGVTIRNVILLVEAVGESGPLEHTGGQVVSELGGVGSPEQGYYAGLPGKLYAKVNEDASGQGPTLFTEAVRLRSDDRIPALGVDRTTYAFALSGDAPVEVRARLIYRRGWRSLIDAKGWTEDGHGKPLADLRAPDFGHLMASASTTVVPEPSAPPDPDPPPHTEEPAPSEPDAHLVLEAGSGCSAGPVAGGGATAALLILAALAGGRRGGRRRREDARR